MKKYLDDGDRVYTSGAFLLWDKDKMSFYLEGLDEGTYFDGEPVEFDEEGKPFIEIE